MSQRLNDLETEILKILSNRVRARWKDIKADVGDEFKKKYSGSGFDVVFSRCLNRLVERNIIWKQKVRGVKRHSYLITAKGNGLAWKLKRGLSVEDLFRDEMLAFGTILQSLRNDAIIMSEGESVLDYFTYFKKLVVELDLETFIRELKIYYSIIDSDEDPLDLSDLMIYKTG